MRLGIFHLGKQLFTAVSGAKHGHDTLYMGNVVWVPARREDVITEERQYRSGPELSHQFLVLLNRFFGLLDQFLGRLSKFLVLLSNMYIFKLLQMVIKREIFVSPHVILF